MGRMGSATYGQSGLSRKTKSTWLVDVHQLGERSHERLIVLGGGAGEGGLGVGGGVGWGWEGGGGSRRENGRRGKGKAWKREGGERGRCRVSGVCETCVREVTKGGRPWR